MATHICLGSAPQLGSPCSWEPDPCWSCPWCACWGVGGRERQLWLLLWNIFKNDGMDDCSLTFVYSVWHFPDGGNVRPKLSGEVEGQTRDVILQSWVQLSISVLSCHSRFWQPLPAGSPSSIRSRIAVHVTWLWVLFLSLQSFPLFPEGKRSEVDY